MGVLLRSQGKSCAKVRTSRMFVKSRTQGQASANRLASANGLARLTVVRWRPVVRSLRNSAGPDRTRRGAQLALEVQSKEVKIMTGHDSRTLGIGVVALALMGGLARAMAAGPQTATTGITETNG